MYPYFYVLMQSYLPDAPKTGAKAVSLHPPVGENEVPLG